MSLPAPQPSAPSALPAPAAPGRGQVPKPVRELKSHRLGTLPWGNEADVRASLATLYEHVVRATDEAIAWYVREKRWKRYFGRGTRVSAILLVAAAALLPLLAQIQATADAVAVRAPGVVPGAADAGTVIQTTHWWTHPAWASVLIALAAALVGLDRFFGFSQGWMRYVDAQMKLNTALDQFDIEWQKHWVTAGPAAPSQEQVLAMLSACSMFAAQVRAIVQAETAEWMVEFRATLSHVDETVRARALDAQSGIINVVVSNGELSPEGWTLTIDGGREERRRGRTAALANLWPAAYTLRARGVIEGKPVSAETAVVLKAGEALTVELTLA